MGGIQELRCIQLIHTYPHLPMLLSSVVSAVRYMMLRKISSTPVHTHPHFSTLTHAAFICGLGSAVHDVAQDLRRHDDDVGLGVERRVARLQTATAVPEALPHLTQLLVAQGLIGGGGGGRGGWQTPGWGSDVAERGLIGGRIQKWVQEGALQGAGRFVSIATIANPDLPPPSARTLSGVV